MDLIDIVEPVDDLLITPGDHYILQIKPATRVMCRVIGKGAIEKDGKYTLNRRSRKWVVSIAPSDHSEAYYVAVWANQFVNTVGAADNTMLAHISRHKSIVAKYTPYLESFLHWLQVGKGDLGLHEDFPHLLSDGELEEGITLEKAVHELHGVGVEIVPFDKRYDIHCDYLKEMILWKTKVDPALMFKLSIMFQILGGEVRQITFVQLVELIDRLECDYQTLGNLFERLKR